MSEITYVFRDDKAFAIREGKVIAAGPDITIVEAQVKEAYGADPHADFLEHGGGGGDPDVGYEGDYGPQIGGQGSCPGCGGPHEGSNFCPNCGEPLNDAPPPAQSGPHGQEMENPYPHDQPSPGLEMGGEAGSYMASVVTPNGLKGTVLGKVAGVWGEEVTVRLENGRIVKLPVGTELNARPVTKQASHANPIERLEARFAAVPDGTRDSLFERSAELARIQVQARAVIAGGVSYADAKRLDEIIVTADVEQHEVAEAIEHLDEVEKIEAPRAFTMGAAHEAAGISREDASWLDESLDQMIKQAEATDFTKLMDEGPEAFAAELPDSAIADTGVTRQMASNFIAEKTAGVDRQIADPYNETFLARVEECRCQQLSSRKQATHKEAAAQEDKYKDLPDEAFFI